MHVTNPLRQQQIATRGFVDSDGSVTGLPPGTFVGRGGDALDTNQVRGPSTYEPGFQYGVGWKFADSSTVSVNFLYIALARYQAAVTGPAPANFAVGALRSVMPASASVRTRLPWTAA